MMRKGLRRLFRFPPLASLKRRVLESDFALYRVYPWLERRRDRRERRAAPALSFSFIHDLKAEAAARGWAYRTRHPATVQLRDPSRMLAEDALALIRRGNELVRQHTSVRATGDRRHGEMYYSQLASVTRYPLPETFTCAVADVLVAAPGGEMVTAQLEAIVESVQEGRMARAPSLDRPPAGHRKLAGTYVPLLSWNGEINYAHWLIDVLPRAAPLSVDHGPDLRFLVPSPLLPFHRESLALVGILDEQLVPVEPGWIHVERAILCRTLSRSIVPHPAPLAELRELLLRGAAAGASPPTRRVFISRRSTRRPLVNEEELLPVLAGYGFEIHRPEELGVAEQVRLFAETDVLLGQHGAGIYNQLFCPPGATVIEIMNPVLWDHGAARVAAALGYTHWVLFGEDVRPSRASRLDARKLEKALAYALEGGEIVEDNY